MARGARRGRRNDGPQRAQFLLEARRRHAQLTGAAPAPAGTTPYVNTIPPQDEPPHPGRRGARAASPLASCAGTRSRRSCKRTRRPPSSAATSPAYQSAATLYEVGFNHFWHAPTDDHGGDLVYIQGHSCPGIYARAFLEGRITEEQMRKLPQGGRRRTGSRSYPHPWLMPDFWQFPTVSMGLGPLMAIYQARFMKYLQGRGLAETAGPQGLGLHGRRRDGRARVAGRDLAGRPRAPRQPDLRHQLQPAAPRRPGARQRQDHPGARDQLPRRGLERHQGDLGLALGPAARRRPRGPLLRAHGGGVDGDYQTYKSRDGAYVREHFFGAKPELRGDGRGHDRRGDLGAQPRRPRPAQGLRGLPRGRPSTTASRR